MAPAGSARPAAGQKGPHRRRAPAPPAPAPPPPRRPPRQGSLDGLLAAKEIVIACGPGGVGKTTTAAAAAAMAACRHGGRVLVLTVDPARRLADALGLAGPGGAGSATPSVRIPDEVFAAAGVAPTGELWAAMLDTKESWDALVRRHAPDARDPRADPGQPAVPQHLGRASSRATTTSPWSASTRSTPRATTT